MNKKNGSLKNVKEDLNVYEYWEKNKVVEYYSMVDELSRITHLPKFICRMVYDAEEKILRKLGIMG